MGDRVRVGDLESALLQIVAVIEQRAADKNALFGSTTTRTSEEFTRMSRLAGPSTRSILYCSPEQPPPMTATRKAPVCAALFFKQRTQLARRVLGHFDETLVADLVIDSRRWGGGVVHPARSRCVAEYSRSGAFQSAEGLIGHPEMDAP